MSISYVTGDATDPQGSGNKVILHVCNDIGAWGKGFVLALSKKFAEPEAAYKKLYADNGNKLILGVTQFVQITNPAPVGGESLYVANMVAQRNTKWLKDGSADDCPPLRYPALYSCLDEVCKFAQANNATVHGPRFGSALAGGDWRVIEAMMEKIFDKAGIAVTIYDFEVI